MDNYSKYKERSPQETILTIQTILNEIGIFPVLRWTGECRKGFFSNRITLHPTAIGVNGKGTDEIYSTASGFGELMERLSNGILLDRPLEPECYETIEFRDSPDEETISLEELLEHPDPFTQWVLSELNEEDAVSNGIALLNMYSYQKNGTDVLTAVPFADPFNNQVVRVPSTIVRYLTGSNGMAAGNTMEEAMVQGLSELLEREAELTILEGKAVPPEIPDEAIESYPFFEQIQELRKDERIRVTLLDCSLGKGWPVVALCIHDLEQGTFGFRLGAHPSFPVAVERTLTEAVQGCRMTEFMARNRIGTEEEVNTNANRAALGVFGIGMYPASLFAEEPGWTYQPWTRFKKTGNHAFLKELLQLLKEEGYNPLFRDTSFLGFPSCYIVIPGFRNFNHFGGKTVRLKRTVQRAGESWTHFPNVSEEELRRIFRLVRYYKNSKTVSVVNMLSGAPISSPAFSNARLGVFLSLQLEAYDEAADFLNRLAAAETDSEELQYLKCLRTYAKLRKAGMKKEKAYRALKQQYMEKPAERVISDTMDRSKILENCFPKLPCPDCERCSIRGTGCQYTEIREIYGKVAKHMKTENVSQERLLELLCSLAVE